MSDGSTQNGTDTLDTDDITTRNGVTVAAGVKVQRAKVTFGDDSVSRDASQAFPLPINIAASQGNIAASTGTVSATAAASVTGVVNTTSVVVQAVASQGNGTIILGGGTYTALTLAFEASADSGTTWFPIDGARSDGSTVETNPSFTAAGLRAWNFICPGYTHVRARVSAITQTVAPTLIITAGPFLYDPSPTVAPIDGQKASYSAQLNGTNVASAVTTSADLFVLNNPAGSGRVIRVTRLAFQVTLATTAAATPLLQLVKRSANDTVGTAVAQTVVPHDSGDPAAGGVVNLYTAAPTVGAAVGPVRSVRLLGTVTAAATAQPNGVEWTFGTRPGERAIVLRPGQALGLMGQAAFATAPTVTGDIDWTEEAA
jgi:hypothetical protein